MEKRLSVSVKKIVGQPNPKEGRWSDVLVFEPEDKNQERTRGRLFTVLDLTGSTALDLAQFGKLVLETLKDTYYSSKEASPLQALEEALHKAQHQLVELVFGPKGAVPDSALNYNFAACVLWGMVLYLVKFGASGIYLYRAGGIEELGEAKDEKVFSASGMVRDKDVVILGSSDFRRTFPASELPKSLDSLDSLVEDLGRPPGVSGLTLRLGLDLVPGEEEEVVIAPVAEGKTFFEKIRALLPKSLILILVLLFLAASAFTIRKRQMDLKTAETARLISSAEQTLSDAKQYVDLNNSRARELFFKAKSDFEAAEEVGGGVLGLSEKLKEIDTLLDHVNKIKKVKPEIATGLKISFDPLSELSSTPEVDESVADVGTYFGNVYFLVPSENQILKSAVIEGGEYAEPQYWVTTENPPLTDAVAMAIDGFIYVLKSGEGLPAGRQVLKFERGELIPDFELKELDRPLKDPKAIFTTIDSEHLYILDAGNQRIVVVDKNGLYESQYVYDGEAQAFLDLKGLVVDEAAKAIYLLDGTKIYKIGM